MSKDYVVPFELTELSGLSLTNEFQAINPDGFPFPCIRLRIINSTYVHIFISYDGFKYHAFLDARDELEINFQTNNAPNNNKSMFSKGTIVYVKRGVDIPKGHSVKLIAYGII